MRLLFSKLTVLVLALAAPLYCLAASGPFVVTNDDSSANAATFYSIGTGGALTLAAEVLTNNPGIAGGYFGMNRVNSSVSDTGCIFLTNAGSGDIAAVIVQGMTLSGTVTGSSADTGTSNGIGLASNSQYLYASFSDSSNIGTFSIGSGCTLSFLGDITTTGLAAGIVDGMAVHGNIMVVTYGDGSIESFNLSTGVPVSNGDKQNSTAAITGNTYPNGIDITQDGHFAIFGDTSTAMVIEVSDISSGKLTPTKVYSFQSSISSSNIMLSPDETYLYISDSQGDGITAAPFNKTTGAVTAGCTSGRLKNYVSGWSYLASLALQSTTGNGSGVYVAEFGSSSGIGIVNLSVSGSSCTMSEAASSPVADPNSSGLLSITNFPPRAF